MNSIRQIDDLARKKLHEISDSNITHIIFVCGGVGCTSGVNIFDVFKNELAQTDKHVLLEQVSCLGLCANGPIAIVYPQRVFYHHLTNADVVEIVKEHIIGGKVVDRLVNTTANDNGGKYEWYHSVGMSSANANGAKLVALGGKVNHPGFIEVSMWTTLRTIIEDIGGGIINDKELKAVESGGPSGECIPADYLDTCIDYDKLLVKDNLVGYPALIVLDQSDCIVDMAKIYLKYIVDEYCGKCNPCRIGNKRLYDILDNIVNGKATLQDLDKAETLAHYVKDNSLCGLGRASTNHFLSTIKYFRHEYIAHIVDKKCQAGVCTASLQGKADLKTTNARQSIVNYFKQEYLPYINNDNKEKKTVDYKIDPNVCIGCTLCSRTCPVGAITGTLRQPHVLDAKKCLKCNACVDVCKKKAIITQ